MMEAARQRTALDYETVVYDLDDGNNGAGYDSAEEGKEDKEGEDSDALSDLERDVTYF